MNLKKISTKQLVNELRTREGIETTIVEPYVDFECKINGPAIVLTVID
ncbi:BC1881 family protein [Clostridium estertheticum]|nr:BC1881 family protein [Clostridium estertheticum]MBU3185629.1 BC1881 family protein [Clostridium estertheticum]